MNSFHIHYHRLKRHYDDAVKTYDHISFLDLSHSLRMWTEIKSELASFDPKFSTAKYFKSARPARKIIKAARSCDYVFAYMPGGVITYANQGQIASVPAGDKKYSLGVSVRKGPTHTELKNFSYVSKLLDEPVRKALSNEVSSRLSHTDWLGSEVVRLARSTSTNPIHPITISREMMIKRTANTLDGSHPRKNDMMEPENKYDAPIHYLLEFKMGGVPLPYFILLKTAQDILGTIPKLIPDIDRTAT